MVQRTQMVSTEVLAELNSLNFPLPKEGDKEGHYVMGNGSGAGQISLYEPSLGELTDALVSLGLNFSINFPNGQITVYGGILGTKFINPKESISLKETLSELWIKEKKK